MKNEIKNCDPLWGDSTFKRTQQIRDSACERDRAKLAARMGLDQDAEENVVSTQKELVNGETKE
ncbi:hypothetical protein [Herminiimonas contaminans]|uniref:Uncharacterized protein n=1 Tax=Herminiimonas contaminans TaxID=1111140 RepID=A0ABS0ES48_9BURK|nr:hypothetical protein [Herminiimonas contaminans]MBF8177670.1 hypothetical protein [Herminiimonas contaminans]